MKFNWFSSLKLGDTSLVQDHVRAQLSLFSIDGGEPLLTRITRGNGGSYERKDQENSNKIFERVFAFFFGTFTGRLEFGIFISQLDQNQYSW